MKKIIAIELDVDEDAFDDDELLHEIVSDQLRDVGPVRSAALVGDHVLVQDLFRRDWMVEALQAASEQEMPLDQIEEIGGEMAFEGWREWIGEMTLGPTRRRELERKVREMYEP